MVSERRSGDRGIALVTVVWILALLAALVGSMSVNSYYHIRVSGSISRSGRSLELAESGFQLWMANLRADALKGDSGVVVTEVMAHNPSNGCGGMLIVKLCAGEKCSGQWIEVYNRGPTSARIGQVVDWDPAGSTVRWPEDKTVKNRLVMPGESFVVSEGTMSEADVEVSTLTFESAQGGVKILDHAGRKCDAVGWDLSGNSSDVSNDFYEGSVLDTVNAPDLKRKANPTAPNVPLDSGNNASDFETHLSFSASTGYDSDLSGPNRQPDTAAYVEVYNTGSDTPDLSHGDFRIFDSHDTDGDPVSMSGEPDKFRIRRHDTLDPFGPAAGAELAPAQVGLIVHGDASAERIGIEEMIDNREIRVFELQEVGGDPPTEQFFHGGLHNQTNETITFEREGSTQVLIGGGWDTHVAINASRDKDVIFLPDRAKHWPISAYKGTPGQVTEGLDHHGEIWSWGGTVEDGSRMDEKIYVPSLRNTRQDGDFGYFRFTHIEDETGKVNLQVPRGFSNGDTYELTPEDGDDDRAMPMADVTEAIRYSQGTLDTDRWLSYGDLLTNDDGPTEPGPFLTGSMAEFEDLTHVYTGYREDNSRKLININTAPFEALKTIRIHEPYGSGPPPDFVTARMAKSIIRQRSGDEPVENDEGHWPVSLESYGNASGEGIRSYVGLCSTLESLNANFDCRTFKKYTTLGSEGIFRAVIQGVALDPDGDTVGRTLLDAVVDRRPVEDRSGPMEVIYKRRR